MVSHMRKFEELAETTSAAAAAIKCSASAYAEGLRVLIERLQLDLDAAEGA